MEAIIINRDLDKGELTKINLLLERNVNSYVFEAFTKQQYKKVIKFTKETKSIDNLSVEKGKKVFIETCSLCHGIKGDGESNIVNQSKDQNKFIYPYNLQKIILDENQIFYI